jgi:hypothetical protein
MIDPARSGQCSVGCCDIYCLLSSLSLPGGLVHFRPSGFSWSISLGPANAVSAVVVSNAGCPRFRCPAASCISALRSVDGRYRLVRPRHCRLLWFLLPAVVVFVARRPHAFPHVEILMIDPAGSGQCSVSCSGFYCLLSSLSLPGGLVHFCPPEFPLSIPLGPPSAVSAVVVSTAGCHRFRCPSPLVAGMVVPAALSAVVVSTAGCHRFRCPAASCISARRGFDGRSRIVGCCGFYCRQSSFSLPGGLVHFRPSRF